MTRIFAIALALALSVASARAQQGTATTIANGTIVITSTFQQILAGNGTRRGCTIQNQGSHVMYVYPGVTTAATTAASLLLQPGQTFLCQATGSSVITDPISMTGTSGDAWVANEQRTP